MLEVKIGKEKFDWHHSPTHAIYKLILVFNVDLSHTFIYAGNVCGMCGCLIFILYFPWKICGVSRQKIPSFISLSSFFGVCFILSIYLFTVTPFFRLLTRFNANAFWLQLWFHNRIHVWTFSPSPFLFCFSIYQATF